MNSLLQGHTGRHSPSTKPCSIRSPLLVPQQLVAEYAERTGNGEAV